MTYQDAEKKLRERLQMVRLDRQVDYHPWQVRRILNISCTTFARLCDEFQPMNTPGRLQGRIESYRSQGGKRRVEYQALVNCLQEMYP